MVVGAAAAYNDERGAAEPYNLSVTVFPGEPLHLPASARARAREFPRPLVRRCRHEATHGIHFRDRRRGTTHVFTAKRMANIALAISPRVQECVRIRVTGARS